MTPVGPRCPDHATQGRPSLRAPARQRAVRRFAYIRTEQPFVSYGLIGLNVLIYLITVAQGAGINSPGGKLFEDWALYGPAVAGGDWWRLITAAFLHGSVLHIGLNMLAVGWLGAPVERYVGHLRYLALYVVSGLAGSAGALIANPTSVTVGASGAVFGILGALLIIEYQATGSLAGQAFMLIVINLAFSLTAYGRTGLLGVAALVAVAVLSVAVSYWKVRGYA